MRKTRRTSVMVRLVALLVITLTFTLCFVSGTFAKYVTSANGSDNAQVAKWGVIVNANGGLFAKEYALDKADTGLTLAVKAEADSKLVAPGTSGDMTKFVLSGKPEVAVNVSVGGANLDLGTNWKYSDDTYYCPIVIKVTTPAGETTINGTEQTSSAAFETAVETAINAYTKNYDAGTDLSTIGGNALSVSWSWAYDSINDAKDTVLGDKTGENIPTIKLSFTVTVTQID